MLFAHGPPASANTLTCGTFGDYYDGYVGTQGQGATEGSWGSIQTRLGTECSTNTNPDINRTSAWVMVKSGDSQQGYVQSGFNHGYGNCTTFFAAVRKNDNSSESDKFGGSCISTDGSTHSYTEQYGSGCGCEYAKIDGTVWMTTGFNPFSYWTYPFRPEFMGEAYYLQSDMPGDISNPTNYSALEGQNGSNNNFYNFSCNGFLNKVNEGAATRTQDGKAWYDRLTSCPSFQIFTALAGQ
jgi:hypothetical protein